MRGFGGGRAGCPAGDAFCTCVFLFGGERSGPENWNSSSLPSPNPFPTFLPSSAGPVMGFSEPWFSCLENRHSTSAWPWAGWWYDSWKAAAHSPHTHGETSEPQVTWDKPSPFPRASPPSFLCLCHCDPCFVGEETGARRGQSSQPVSNGFGVRFVLES